MKTKLLLLLFCLSSLSVMGQIPVSRDKCKTCGKLISQCEYNGKHSPKPEPKPEKSCNTCGKTISKCLYKGKHPEKKCSECGKTISMCQYNGEHPVEEQCSECDKPISKCKYNGKHPAPEAAGYDFTFNCNVATANLYVDGNAYGSASGTRFIKTGNHNIKVTAEEYNDYFGTITVNSQNLSCSIILEKKPELTKPVASATNTINGHEWVDLGLSVKWATMNVGASSPSYYGSYYAWGETSTKSSYNWKNCFDCVKPRQCEKDAGWDTYKLSGQTRITPSSGHDIAHEDWGGSWRMPTESEYKELINECKWTWTSRDGHNGYNVTGPNGNSIFLPAAGWRTGTKSKCVGEGGYYWSSTLGPSCSGYARNLSFNSSSKNTYNDDRCDGRCIRPVTE